MLIVKTTVGASKINGLGLFAAERIPKGTTTWKFDPIFDLLFEPKDLEKMSEDQRDLIKMYAYLSPESGKYVYSIDNTRFTNHSSTDWNIDTAVSPGDIETTGVANRDIEMGEEMLVNYRMIDAADRDSDEEYLGK